MTSKEVLDQIRDLQSFIDDFAAEAGTNSTPGTPTSIENNDEKTQIEAPIILQKPNEKTEEIIQAKQPEKTLVEQSISSTKTEAEPLSILSYDLNLSDDFSSLVDQFKDLKVSPIEIKKLQQQNIFKDLVVKIEEEKVQLEPVIISVTDKKQPLSATTTRSRRTSVSSKRSQKSSKSSKSTRRLQNEKKQFKQSSSSTAAVAATAIATASLPLPQQQKYIERSFDEMMRIPDIYERLAFYQKTLDLCLKAESPIASWCKSNKQKGKPEQLLQGYVPPARLLSPEMPHHNDFGSMSSAFSGSISMFLKKATISTPSVSKRHLPMDNNGYGTPYIQSSNSSSIFGRSISRLSLSRSSQIPRYDHTMPSPSNRFQNKNKVYNKKSLLQQRQQKQQKQQQQQQQQQQGLSPLSIDYSSSSSTYTATPRSTSSSPTSFGSTSTINSRGESTTINSELAYMMNVLPQIDMRMLQNALNEAKGDPMVAISIAVSTSKERSNELNSTTIKSTKPRRRYGNKV